MQSSIYTRVHDYSRALTQFLSRIDINTISRARVEHAKRIGDSQVGAARVSNDGVLGQRTSAISNS